MSKKHKAKFHLLILPIIMSLMILKPGQLVAQTEIGFLMPKGVDRVEVPFEKFSNLIVIPVQINDVLTLKFIIDTGAESIILTEKLFAEMLGFDFVREINIHGPGIIDSVKAFVASNVNISLPGGISGNGLNLLVLERDYLELHKNLGEEVYGIIGYDLFSRFVISIDYDDGIMTLQRPSSYKPRRFMEALPLQIEGTKPYVLSAFHQKDQADTLKLMVDTGASHAALLDVSTMDHIVMPDKLVATRLGRGLAGEIPGYIGRIDKCAIGNLKFDDVIISIPEEGAYIKAIKRGSRHGTIGGDILSRLNVVFDYPNEKLYIRKGRSYSDPFEYNMSGMTLITEGSQLDSLVVIEVLKKSPAHHAGIRVGDQVLKINGMNLNSATISEINALLRRKHGLKVKVVILRGDRKIKKRFKLKRLV
ncbi:MAG: aspartyl protease family protein [Cyclobacteriaceae bacterium]